MLVFLWLEEKKPKTKPTQIISLNSTALDRTVQRMITREIERLPKEEKELIKAHYYGRIPIKRLAGILGISEKETRQKMKKAIEKLKQSRSIRFLKYE